MQRHGPQRARIANKELVITANFLDGLTIGSGNVAFITGGEHDARFNLRGVFYLLLISQGSLCARSHGTMLTIHGIIKILDSPNQLRRHLERYRLATLSVYSQEYGLDRDGGIYVRRA